MLLTATSCRCWCWCWCWCGSSGRFQKDKSLMVVRGFSAVPYEFVHYEIAKHAAVVDMTKCAPAPRT